MSNAPISFWGKFSVITGFLTALVGLITVFGQCSGEKTYNPIRSTKPEVDVRSSREMGNYCYDALGNRRCQLLEPAPIGSLCFCPGIGTGVVGP